MESEEKPPAPPSKDYTINLLRGLFVCFAGLVGTMVGDAVVGGSRSTTLTGTAIGFVGGLAVVLVDRLMRGVTLRMFSSATFGLFVGSIFAKLLLSSGLLLGTSNGIQWIVGLVTYSVFAYLGMMLAIRSNRDEFALIIPYVRFKRAQTEDVPILVDSNVLIDGRLATLCATGFISTSLIIPRFVIHELQILGDSSDLLKRERGRSALERVNTLRNDPALSVSIHDGYSDSDEPTDVRLVKLGKLLDVRILTNDVNLCTTARIQGVGALNLHDLNRALRPTLEPGQQLDILLTKEGREPHQGVGYLPDGTMIVVNHGRAHLGKTMPIVVASALQTSAGRLYFAELRHARDVSVLNPRAVDAA